MGRNNYENCNACKKAIRSDKIKVHKKSNCCSYNIKQCNICGKIMIAQNMSRHKRKHDRQNIESTQNIVKNIKDDQKKFEESKVIGKVVQDTIKNEVIDPTAVREEYTKAMELRFNNCRVNLPSDCTLKPWQKHLLLELEPSNRSVIWVIGRKGAEGKSFMQNYLVEMFGAAHVFHSAMTSKNDGILHELSKQQLCLIDVFIFNIPRSFNVGYVPYHILEDIKDGKSISTKYDSKNLRFNTPNLLLVFANELPQTDKMSKDRWVLLEINRDELNHVWTYFFKSIYINVFICILRDEVVMECMPSSNVNYHQI